MNIEELPLVVRVLREDLANKITAQSAAVAARNAEKSGVKAPKWRSLLVTPSSTPSFMTEFLSPLMDIEIDKDNAHDAAHIAKSLYAMADYFAEQASLWATDLASDHGPVLPDDEIQKLTASCDDVFQFIFKQMPHLYERKNDPAIEQELVELIGQPILAKKMADGTVKYQLDIERIRSSKTGESSDRKMVLEVNGFPFPNMNFAQAVDTAFSIKSPAFLDALKATNVFNTEGEPMLFDHKGETYTVKITTTSV